MLVSHSSPRSPSKGISKPISTITTSPIEMDSDNSPIYRTMEDFMQEATRQFADPITIPNMMDMSTRLRNEFKEELHLNSEKKLQRRPKGHRKSKSLSKKDRNELSMLPSFNHALPTGLETGNFLSLDVGGSGIRVALVSLLGKDPVTNEGRMTIIKNIILDIDETVRRLSGRDFFDWLAEGVETMVFDEKTQQQCGNGILNMGVAWSFPIDLTFMNLESHRQTSIQSGKLLDMGKGFCASDGLLGEDLAGLIMVACQKRNLPIQVSAIINDGSATLLSRAYATHTTRFGLILGTGTNVSVMLPLSCIPFSKLAGRPESWMSKAKEVLVNTEYSMFGRDILPFTKWDEDLNRHHRIPDFQPYEHFVGGRYIGELVRLVVQDAVKEAGMFGGEMPQSLQTGYTLATKTLGVVEADKSEDLKNSTAHFHKLHPLPSGKYPGKQDMLYLRDIARLVTRRAASLLATAIHAFWLLRIETSANSASTSNKDNESVSFACNGGIVQKYPGFINQCQADVNALREATNAQDGQERGEVILDIADEAAVYGAAVAAVVAANLED